MDGANTEICVNLPMKTDIIPGTEKETGVEQGATVKKAIEVEAPEKRGSTDRGREAGGGESGEMNLNMSTHTITDRTNAVQSQ